MWTSEKEDTHRHTEEQRVSPVGLAPLPFTQHVCRTANGCLARATSFDLREREIHHRRRMIRWLGLALPFQSQTASWHRRKQYYLVVIGANSKIHRSCVVYFRVLFERNPTIKVKFYLNLIQFEPRLSQSLINKCFPITKFQYSLRLYLFLCLNKKVGLHGGTLSDKMQGH